MAVETVVGQGAYTYTVDKAWGRRTGGVTAFGVSQGVTGDSKDRVYVFVRSPKTEVLVFERDGTFVHSWGDGQFTSPHGIWCSPQDELYITDVAGHTVSKWTTEGKLLRMWGERDKPGAPGVPFNRPTKAVVAEDGEMYVSDGYGNRQVHRYDRAGNLMHSWGSDGTGPGQFTLVHDVWVDGDRVLVCDRQNRRVEVFDRAGRYVTEWANLQNPMQIYVRDGLLYMVHAYAFVSVRSPEGALLAQWPYESILTHEREKSPHSVWVDSRGDIYVAEVVGENGLQKFVRQ
jgi:sugar lactone lactonase YvrE